MHFIWGFLDPLRIWHLLPPPPLAPIQTNDLAPDYWDGDKWASILG